jgi:hypothetical protein
MRKKTGPNTSSSAFYIVVSSCRTFSSGGCNFQHCDLFDLRWRRCSRVALDLLFNQLETADMSQVEQHAIWDKCGLHALEKRQTTRLLFRCRLYGHLAVQVGLATDSSFAESVTTHGHDSIMRATVTTWESKDRASLARYGALPKNSGLRPSHKPAQRCCFERGFSNPERFKSNGLDWGVRSLAYFGYQS